VSMIWPDEAKSAAVSWAPLTTERRMVFPITSVVLWKAVAARSAFLVSSWRTMSAVTRVPIGMSTAA